MINEEFTGEQLARYARHFSLPQVGRAGQLKLRQAKVLLVGAGGLGSPMALYLAAAGVGTIGIVDDDDVDLSNLQRQVLHGTGNRGQRKLVSAVARLYDLNPDVKVQPFPVRLRKENALKIIADFDVVADGADNFPTRYLVNDACGLLKKPLVSASIFGFEGQLSVFHYQGGPCYRCLYPEPPPPGAVPSCAEGGVLGVLPGVMGSLQATEVIKIILGIGQIASGRLLLYDALNLSLTNLSFEKTPSCKLCGTPPTLTELIDYEQFCGFKSASQHPQWEPLDIASRLDELQILDVREPWERAVSFIDPSFHIPLADLGERLNELDPNAETVVYCAAGYRSLKACEVLSAHGFGKVGNLRGGIQSWSAFLAASD